MKNLELTDEEADTLEQALLEIVYYQNYEAEHNNALIPYANLLFDILTKVENLK